VRQMRDVLVEDGLLLVTVPNGYGYFEWERLLEECIPQLNPMSDDRQHEFVERYGRAELKLRHASEWRREHWQLAVTSLASDQAHYQRFTPGQISRLLTSQGFKIIDFRNRTFLAGNILSNIVRDWDSFLAWNCRVADRLPSWLCSGWMIAASRVEHIKNEGNYSATLPQALPRDLVELGRDAPSRTVAVDDARGPKRFKPAGGLVVTNERSQADSDECIVAVMPKFPLVSIVTPSYNSAQFLERCIESVLAQDYPHVEHIIQDAASTDGTVDILRRYSGQVDWVSEPDKGQADGLNRALQRCRGDIIGVLNADDEYLPHAVSWAVENLAQFPDVAAVYGDQYDVDENGVAIHKTYGPEYDFDKMLCVEQVIPAQAAFIRRAHFEQVGLLADVTRKTCPDYEMWVRIGLKFPMRHVPGFVARYRWHSGSEGRQASVIPAMVKSKREVMERVFNDPATPSAILSLRQRAHAGAVWWGAIMLQANGEVTQSLLAFFRSLCIHPSAERRRSFLQVMLRSTTLGRLVSKLLKFSYRKMLWPIKVLYRKMPLPVQEFYREKREYWRGIRNPGDDTGDDGRRWRAQR
jgi:glycosyltransferase involved in cell wall biosynthesis